MSDAPGGPDWFKATDGKWYRPAPANAASGPQFAAKKKGGCLKAFLIGAGALVALIIVIIIAGAALTGSKSPSTATTLAAGSSSHQAASSSNAALNDVTVSKCDTDSTLNYPEAVLAVVNHSSKTSNYLITVAFEAPDGSQFDTGNAAVQTLAAGQTGSATAQSLKSGAPASFTCKVTDVTRLAS